MEHDTLKSGACEEDMAFGGDDVALNRAVSFGGQTKLFWGASALLWREAAMRRAGGGSRLKLFLVVGARWPFDDCIRRGRGGRVISVLLKTM